MTRWGIATVRNRLEEERENLARSEQRVALDEAEAAAGTLNRLFSKSRTDFAAQTVVARLRESGLEHSQISALLDALPGLEKAARGARRPPEGQGAHKDFPNPKALTSRQMCAAVVWYVWREARGSLAPQSSRKAWEACELVWRAAEDSPQRDSNAGNDPNARWREHLKTVKPNLEPPGPKPFEWHVFLMAISHQGSPQGDGS
jgi:hypothetical protein